jgi:uncharacterized protein (UPF0303 family)
LVGLTSKFLIEKEESLIMPACNFVGTIVLVKIAKKVDLTGELPITIELQPAERIAFCAAYSGSTADNDSWISRKSRVVLIKSYITLYEKVYAEESGIDCHKENNLLDEIYAIHGRRLRLITKSKGFLNQC